MSRSSQKHWFLYQFTIENKSSEMDSSKNLCFVFGLWYGDLWDRIWNYGLWKVYGESDYETALVATVATKVILYFTKRCGDHPACAVCSKILASPSRNPRRVAYELRQDI